MEKTQATYTHYINLTAATGIKLKIPNEKQTRPIIFSSYMPNYKRFNKNSKIQSHHLNHLVSYIAESNLNHLVSYIAESKGNWIGENCKYLKYIQRRKRK